ncbi:restriction endonuclease subunit S [Erysipelothrix urinaevulpis]|uniref:restriction endonuclease subunit S n=1 Tax=Erysipelothrix urinaevulpis TaxID=2683717 RepID=UPI00135BDC68|nr:restriction endonuclease subunit S [Erysipelothrix urinaevulpis]
MKTKRKTPDIRFRGFSDDWEQRKLKNISKINPSSKIPSKFNYVDLESVQGTELKSFKRELIETAPSRAQRLANKGDLFYQTVRPYQKNNYLFKRDDTDFVFSTGYAQIRPEIDGDFILSLVQTTKFVNLVLVRCTGTSYPAINSNDLSLIPIKIPKNNFESMNIGALFSNIDKIITLHQRKLQQLQEVKRGMLLNMFPKRGNKIPKYRVKEYCTEWDNQYLGNLTEIKTGSSDLQDASENGIYPLYVRSEEIERSDKYIYDGEAILIPGEGRLGEIYHYINGKFDYHQRVYRISNFLDSNTNGKFILYSLQNSFKRHAMTHTVKATVDSLRLPILTEFPILIPTFEEQVKIGLFFEKLDRMIELQESEIELLEETKKGFLQKMFV